MSTIQDDSARKAAAETRKTRFSRYGIVSVASTVLGIVLLYLLNGVAGVYAPIANLGAAAIGSPPIYLLHRFWAWSDQPIESERKAIVQFVAATVLSVIAATAAVFVADALWGDGLIAVGAALFAYGVIWLVRFSYFDLVVFAQ